MNPGFNGTRLKTTLKMAVSKLRFLQEKKLALGKQQRRQLADLLGAGKETSATIRVENIIREDIYVELLELLELYCELLLARISLVLDLQRTEVDSGLAEAVALVIYSAGHVEVKEVASLGEMLRARYGPEYSRRVLEGENVAEKVAKRCDIEPPSEELVVLYLTEISRAYEVPYSRDAGGEEKEEREEKQEKQEKEEKEEKDEKEEKEHSEAKKIAPELSEFDKLKERFAALKR